MRVQVCNRTHLLSAGHMPGIGAGGYSKQNRNPHSHEVYILVSILMIYYRTISSV